MTGSEKLNKVLLHLNMNANQFATALKLPRAQGIYDILDGTIEISKKMAKKISDAFPEINQVFLLTGEGEMITKVHEHDKKLTVTNDRDQSRIYAEKNYDAYIQSLHAQINSLETTLAHERKKSELEIKGWENHCSYLQKLLDETIKTNYQKILDNHGFLMRQIASGFHLTFENLVEDDQKRAAVLDEHDKLTFSEDRKT